jgi:hypothetical protein
MSDSWEKAMRLEKFIYSYIPRGWVKPIGNVSPYPWLLGEEYDQIEKGLIPERFHAGFYIEAINAFFKKMQGQER